LNAIMGWTTCWRTPHWCKRNRKNYTGIEGWGEKTSSGSFSFFSDKGRETLFQYFFQLDIYIYYREFEKLQFVNNFFFCIECIHIYVYTHRVSFLGLRRVRPFSMFTKIYLLTQTPILMNINSINSD